MPIQGIGPPAEAAIEMSREAVRSARTGASWMTTLVSGAALLASGVSLWESTLKQPDLKVYVTDNLSYTRDPWGGYEVIAVPLTIANGGARDGAVIALGLEVKGPGGTTELLSSAYTVDASYFGATDDVSARRRRPKLPFAPLSIAGRSSYTGTVLFYPAEFRERKVVEPKTHIDMKLHVTTPRPDGFIERVLGKTPASIVLAADVPNFLPGALLSGEMARLKVTAGGGGP